MIEELGFEIELAGAPSRHGLVNARGYFVTATDTGVGKTFVTAGLAAALRARGRDVAVFKPVQSGALADDPEGDAAVLGADCVYAFKAPLAPLVAARARGEDDRAGADSRAGAEPRGGSTRSCSSRAPAGCSCRSRRGTGRGRNSGGARAAASDRRPRRPGNRQPHPAHDRGGAGARAEVAGVVLNGDGRREHARQRGADRSRVRRDACWRRFPASPIPADAAGYLDELLG